MTPQEVIEAINKAETIYVHVLTSTSYDGSAHHYENFRVAKEDAIAAMKEIRETEYVPNVVVEEVGKVIIIGRELLTPLAENFSHFESNNGNF